MSQYTESELHYTRAFLVDQIAVKRAKLAEIVKPIHKTVYVGTVNTTNNECKLPFVDLKTAIRDLELSNDQQDLSKESSYLSFNVVGNELEVFLTYETVIVGLENEKGNLKESLEILQKKFDNIEIAIKNFKEWVNMTGDMNNGYL